MYTHKSAAKRDPCPLLAFKSVQSPGTLPSQQAHISKKLYGESELAKEWLERIRMLLLSEGFVGMEHELLMLRKGLKTKRRKMVDSLSHD